MVSNPVSIKARLARLHRLLAWLGFAAMLLWGVSGLLHPWLTTFGVQQKTLSPPQREINLNNSLGLETILQQAGIRQAQAVRIVVGEASNLLQVTESQLARRRYFNLQTGEELRDHDYLHAAFLARHFMQLPQEEIRSIQRITSFSEAYPSVNRLLPVYQVNFNRPDGLQVYIYTETGAVAGVSDHTKQLVQSAFQLLHTWSWVPSFAETPRVLAITALVGILFLMACSGAAMLLLIRRKVRASGARHWHRRFALLAVLPVMMFSFSGVYHVIQQGWPDDSLVMQAPPAMRLDQLFLSYHVRSTTIKDGGTGEQISKVIGHIPIHGLSLVNNQHGELHYRFALPINSIQLPQGEDGIRSARFQGLQPTGPALYVNAETGQPWPAGDREMALQLAEQHTGLQRDSVQSINLVTRFGGDYDFRNKRLPVWKLVYGSPENESIFIDTASGMLVDRIAHSARPEIWSFSMLHKWNFLSAAGRNIQNGVMCVAVLLMLLTAFLGLKSRRR